MPWYISLLGSIAVIMICIYKKLNIGLTMIFGAVSLGLLSFITIKDFFAILLTATTNSVTVMLFISILLLGILGQILKETGALQEIIASLTALVADIRIITAILPALVGMLTVPGGAILSAPLCAEAGMKLRLPPDRQAAINIWFRHVFYFALPLFPSLILAAQLSEVNIGRLVLHNLPLVLIGTVFGFYYLFKGFPSQEKGFFISPRATRRLLISLAPLLVVLVLVIIFDLYFPWALLAGIVFALLNYLPKQNQFSRLIDRIKTMILPGINIPTAFVIVGIMIYKEMLTSTGVISDLTNLVLGLGIPVILLIALISFLVGMLTGDNSASVAILFPMFMPLLPSGSYIYSAYIAFLYAGSTAGHIISPAHPCFSLTKEYYRADMFKIVVLIIPLLAVVIAAGFLITSLFGWF
ncbi:MAG: DUF401 family protein [Bacillota bacterium]|nr:DUF401 family protein [Bacillota bacterium]